jgi:hypothetical protein
MFNMKIVNSKPSRRGEAPREKTKHNLTGFENLLGLKMTKSLN